MNKSLALFALICALGFGADMALADTPTACSLYTLRGTYAFANTGTDGAVA